MNGITPFLKTCGYNPKKDVIFLPMSGLLGHNIKEGVKDTVAPWYCPSLSLCCIDGNFHQYTLS